MWWPRGCQPPACIGRGLRGCAAGHHSPRGQGLETNLCLAWPVGAAPQVSQHGSPVHVQEAWGYFQKGQGGKPAASSHFVGAPGRGSTRTRRPYQRRRKYLSNAKAIFMGKYKEFLEDTCVVEIAAVRDMHAWRRSLTSTMAMMATMMTGDSGDDDDDVRD